MVSISSWRLDLPGILRPKVGIVHPTLPFQIIHCKRRKLESNLMVPIKVPNVRNMRVAPGRHSVKCASFVERNYRPSVDGDENPYFINVMVQAFQATKSVLQFLAEQPSQLKYIEWPGFQSTLKTATLALVLVGLFIVALSSIDSALSYILALFLRRAA